MSVVLVDSKYFGCQITRARKTLKIKRTECSRLLNIPHNELIKIENGKILIPERIIEKIVTNGMAMILCKRRK